MKKVSIEEAGNILSEKTPEKYFWLKNGKPIKSLQEFHEAASVMDNEVFSHHVNQEKNDFSNWVMHVHHDGELANKLKKASTQKEIKKMVESRIRQLENIIGTRKKEVAKQDMIAPLNAKKASIKAVPKKPVGIKKIQAKKTKGFAGKVIPVKIEQAPKLAQHMCPPKYFLKCSSVHFILGVAAGFLIGFIVAFTL